MKNISLVHLLILGDRCHVVPETPYSIRSSNKASHHSTIDYTCIHGYQFPSRLSYNIRCSKQDGQMVWTGAKFIPLCQGKCSILPIYGYCTHIIK